MTLQTWLLYLSVVLTILVSPGPSALLCIAHGARHGTARTAATVACGMAASLTLMALSAAGLGTLAGGALAASQW